MSFVRLCIGSLNGEIRQGLIEIGTVNKRYGPFDLGFIVGELFGDKEDEESAEDLRRLREDELEGYIR